MSIKFFGKLLTIELRNGVGIDLEFCDSRPVWGYNEETEEVKAYTFEGVVLNVPLLTITFGTIYTEETNEQ